MKRDRKYLDHMRTERCIVTGLYSQPDDAIDPMHIGTGGKGLKNHDSMTLPVLHSIHQEGHQRGEMTVILEYLARDKSLLREVMRAYAEKLYKEWEYAQSM